MRKGRRQSNNSNIGIHQGDRTNIINTWLVKDVRLKLYLGMRKDLDGVTHLGNWETDWRKHGIQPYKLLQIVEMFCVKKLIIYFYYSFSRSSVG